jgi:hypothetical protein
MMRIPCEDWKIVVSISGKEGSDEEERTLVSKLRRIARCANNRESGRREKQFCCCFCRHFVMKRWKMLK